VPTWCRTGSALKAGASRGEILVKVTKEMFPGLCEQRGLPRPEPEFVFHPTRKWAFDFAFPTDPVFVRDPVLGKPPTSFGRLALEIDGGIWKKGRDGKIGGRHNRPKGFSEDCVKLNEAILLGWFVLRCTTEQFGSGEAMGWVMRAFGRGS